MLSFLVLKVTVAVMSTKNISQTLTYRSNIAIANRYEVEYNHLIGIFRFDLDPLRATIKIHGEDHVHFDLENL